MRKKICKCGKIVAENDLCCKKKERLEKIRRYEKENPEETAFLNSNIWKKKTKRIKERDNYHCQRCLLKYGIIETRCLEVHHIKSRKNFPHLRLEDDNLITVCKTCNIQLGTSDKLDFTPKYLEEDLYDYNLF